MVAREQLRLFGLTDNEARAYEALLRFGRQTPAALAPRAGVSRGRVYQVLDALAHKGFATAEEGSTKSFSAVDPRTALGSALQVERNRLDEVSAQLDNLCDVLTALAEPAADDVPAIEILRRPEQIALRFQQLQAEAQHEVLAFVRPARVAGPENTQEFDALARGVRMVALYERRVLDDSDNVRELRRFMEAGEEARVVDQLPMKLAIFDRRRAIMPLSATHDPAMPFTPVVVHDLGLVSVLAAGFDHVWETAASIDHHMLSTDGRDPHHDQEA